MPVDSMRDNFLPPPECHVKQIPIEIKGGCQGFWHTYFVKGKRRKLAGYGKARANGDI